MNRYFTEDASEVRAIRTITTPDGPAVVARVLNPTGPEDAFRVYPQDTTSGIVAICGATAEQVMEAARRGV